MWNPKRVTLLVAGFVLFAAFYVVYNYFLGGITGLPPLPEWAKPNPDNAVAGPPREYTSTVDEKLKLAFGLGRDEIKRTIKLYIPKRTFALAANTADIEKDGSVKLTPFSGAIFGKGTNNGFPEITTVQSREAILIFDKPITSLTELGSRKIVAGELHGEIIIKNNRMTESEEDDIELRVVGKPLLYKEADGKIWSDGIITMLDLQTKPNPTTVRGQGLDLFLTKEPSPAEAGKAKNKNAVVNGVDLVVLRSHVEMHLYPDARSGFPGSGEDKRPSGPAVKKPDDGSDKAHVVIRTQGNFNYDLNKDLAEFDSPPPEAGQASKRTAPGEVKVYRYALNLSEIKGAAGDRSATHLSEGPIPGGPCDQLLCDHLTLQFRKKAASNNNGKNEARGNDREIVSADATCLPKSQVTLSSDSEKLNAFCSQLNYTSGTLDKGAQTVLHGFGERPLIAIKDNHQILASQLVLIANNSKGQGQRIEAKGPGQVDLFDKSNLTNPYPVHAVWHDLLISSKDKVGDKELDLLTFTGEAAFRDDEHKQYLSGDQLHVWLEPSDASAPPPGAKQTPAGGGSRQRPVKVVAIDNVNAESPEMVLQNAKRFTILFEERVQSLPPLSEAPPSAQGSPPPVQASPPVAEKEQNRERKQIYLTAHYVTANVRRLGPKNELHEMFSEGDVHVTQEADKADEKGIDIRGDQLILTHQSDGDILKVFGDAPKVARLEMRDVVLVGFKIHIDQKENLATVDGMGAMSMPSNTTFDGGKPSKPGTRIRIDWTKEMYFSGQWADFIGDVRATQDEGKLICQKLQITLDRFVSFKSEGQKDRQGAKVEKMVAHGGVDISDTVYDEKTGVLKRRTRMLGNQMDTDNKIGRFDMSGPGIAAAIQPGSESGPMSGGRPAPRPSPGQAAHEVLKLTRIDYTEHMVSLLKDTTRHSIFTGKVDVYHLPADRFDIPIDIHKLPKDGMYLRCERLEVITPKDSRVKKNQLMVADGVKYFCTPEFYGEANRVLFDETQEQLKFEGVNGAPVTIWKIDQPGQQERKYIRGQTIIYNRTTGQFSLERGSVLSWSN